jgi:ankyrin repeat protein
MYVCIYLIYVSLCSSCEKSLYIQLLIFRHFHLTHAQGECTPLYFAASKGFEAVVRLLITSGADVNKGDKVRLFRYTYTQIGKGPLFCASDIGHESIVDVLIEAGADINAAVLPIRETALMRASQRGYPSVIKKLISAGARIDDTTQVHG